MWKVTSILIVLIATAAGGVAIQRAGSATHLATSSANRGYGKPRYEVSILRPAAPPAVRTGVYDLHGKEVTATCVACHATREPNPRNRRSEDLDDFHKGLTFQHGSNACLSCHNKDDYNSLRLADGASVSFSDVMTLCAQCHGPQYRDYQHGSHGGMTGYWDLSRGPRTRNNCLHCHDPHAPAYVGALPAPPPRDRFLTPPHSTHTQGNAHE